MMMMWWSLSFIAIFISFELCHANRNNNRRCASCNQNQFEEYKMMRQEQILDDLLAKLELVSKPNVTVDYNNLPPLGRASPRVKQMVEKSIQEKKHRYRRGASYSEDSQEYYPSLYETDAEVSTQISFIKSSTAPLNFRENGEIALFNFSGNFYTKVVTDATLHIFIRAPDTLNNDDAMSVRVNIYEKFLNGSIGDKIATKHVHLHGYSVPYGVFKVHLDTFDVQRWLSNRNEGNDVLGVYVEALHDGENLAVHPGVGESDTMFLELELLDGSTRTKRTPHTCQADANETKCCLHDLMIDFEKVGWEFVIAPKRYNAFICSGECSSGQMSTSARGSIAQHAKVDFFQCCHPKEYAGITIVYVTADDQIWVKEVSGMIARKCGCA